MKTPIKADASPRQLTLYRADVLIEDVAIDALDVGFQ